jgi:ketosteroid isomerase-like protein
MVTADQPEVTLQMLWDIEQIKQLKARYFRLLDAKDWDAFADLFTDDCVHHLPQESTKPTVGNTEYFADLRHFLGTGVTTHHGHMPEITLLSDTEAEGIWSMFDYVQVDPSGSPPVNIQGYGHYFETYRKGADGRWRISSKRNTRQRLDEVAPRNRLAGT